MHRNAVPSTVLQLDQHLRIRSAFDLLMRGSGVIKRIDGRRRML
jgi:hypothetical protein